MYMCLKLEHFYENSILVLHHQQLTSINLIAFLVKNGNGY